MFAIPFVVRWLGIGTRLDYLIIGYLTICVIVTLIHGRRKEIGIWWVLFFSVFFTPLVGYLLAYYSPRWNGGKINVPKPTVASISLTILLGLIATYTLVFALSKLDEIYSEKYFAASLVGMLVWPITFGVGALYTSRLKRYRFQPLESRLPKRMMVSEITENTRNRIYIGMSIFLFILLVIAILREVNII